ncbi:unnamed protein product, partial [Medioppia subpectinata]
DWCRFSQILAPVFQESYTKVLEEFPEPGRVLFGKVDCEHETKCGLNRTAHQRPPEGSD